MSNTQSNKSLVVKNRTSLLINKVDVIAQNTNFYLVETKQIRFFYTILLECERHVIDKELLQVEKYILLSFWKHNIVQSSNKNLSRHKFGDKLCKILLRQIRERSFTQDSEETVNRNIFTAHIAWLISSSVSHMAKPTRKTWPTRHKQQIWKGFYLCCNLYINNNKVVKNYTLIYR